MSERTTTTAPRPPHGNMGVLLVGHGTRDRQGQAAFLSLARRVAGRLPHERVHACFLELAEPNIEAAIAAGAADGVRQWTVVPVLLFAAGHALRDIPEQTRTAAERCGTSIARQTDVLAWQPKLLELSALRYRQALEGREPAASDDTLLIWVARGSRHPECLANLQRFAAARRELIAVGETRFAFVSVSEPRFEDVLREAAGLAVRRVVVQPHFLFPGELPAQVHTRVRELAEDDSEREWLAADVLGDHDLLAAAIASRVREQAG